MDRIDSYREALLRQRAGRIEAVGSPDGWLAAIGLERLRTGRNRIGSAPDNEIVVPGMAAHAGHIELGPDGRAVFVSASDGGVANPVEMLDTAANPDTPTIVRLGRHSFHVVDRDGVKSLRIKDAEAPARSEFSGIDFYEVDPEWRILAGWEPLSQPFEMHVATVWGQVDTVEVTHRASFKVGSRHLHLYPTHFKAGKVVFMFADRTSGRETNGTGRFLFAEPPADGTIELDFNRAINPPSAFTYFATCPIAPPRNRLEIAVPAGERAYRHSAGEAR